MNRKQRRAERAKALGNGTENIADFAERGPPHGYLDFECSETGARDRIAYWLPATAYVTLGEFTPPPGYTKFRTDESGDRTYWLPEAVAP